MCPCVYIERTVYANICTYSGKIICQREHPIYSISASYSTHLSKKMLVFFFFTVFIWGNILTDTKTYKNLYVFHQLL